MITLVAHRGYKRLTRIVTVAIIISIATSAWMAWTLFHAPDVGEAAMRRVRQLEELNLRAQWLQNAAERVERMSAALSDPSMEAQYVRFQKQMDNTRDELVRNLDGEYPRSYAANIEESDVRLDVLEENILAPP